MLGKPPSQTGASIRKPQDPTCVFFFLADFIVHLVAVTNLSCEYNYILSPLSPSIQLRGCVGGPGDPGNDKGWQAAF